MRILATAASLALMACTGDSGDSSTPPTGTTGETGSTVGDCIDAPMGLELGTGATEFIQLSANDPVVIVHGPQGGWHVDVAGVVTNVGQEVSVLPSLTVVSTGRQIAGDQQPNLLGLASYDDGSCTGEYFGVRAFVDEIDAPNQDFICGLEGEALELTVLVEDFGNGQTVEQTITVTAELDAVDATGTPPSNPPNCP